MDKIDREIEELIKYPGFKHDCEQSIRDLNNGWLPLSEAARILKVPCSRLAAYCRKEPLAKHITRKVHGVFFIHKTACGEKLRFWLSHNPVFLSNGDRFWW